MTVTKSTPFSKKGRMCISRWESTRGSSVKVSLRDPRVCTPLQPDKCCSLYYTVLGLPRPDFSLKFTPSPTTLFRFSALTFNGHHIHLDRDYAHESEGYPGKSITTVSEPQIASRTGNYRTSRAWAAHGPDVARNPRAPLP